MFYNLFDSCNASTYEILSSFEITKTEFILGGLNTRKLCSEAGITCLPNGFQGKYL